jgi:hypothetical protein
MTKRTLFISLLLPVLALVGFNALMGRLSTPLPHVMLRRINTEPEPDYLALGNSQVMAAIDEAAFHRGLTPQARSGPILNTGCGGIFPSETAQFYFAARRRFPSMPCVILGYMFTQLTSPTDASWHDLAGNRALPYFADFDRGLAYYRPKSWIEQAQFRLVHRLPVVYERLSIWRRVGILRDWLGKRGLPAERMTSFGRVADFENDPFQPRSPALLAEDCRTVLNEHRGLSAPVLDIIRQARAAGSSVFLVRMPLPKGRREYFAVDDSWEKYQRHIQNLAEAEGATLVDAIDWFSDDGKYFVDNLHLTAAGAAEFSSRLAPLVSVEAGKPPAR